MVGLSAQESNPLFVDLRTAFSKTTRDALPKREVVIFIEVH
jgi:hypothetical protein